MDGDGRGVALFADDFYPPTFQLDPNFRLKMRHKKNLPDIVRQVLNVYFNRESDSLT
jgi:hypothetical protein